MNVSYKWGLDGLVGISEIQFYVNMSLQTILGNFNPYSDFIDIVGSFNNWNGDNYHLMEYGGGIYSISVEGFYPGEMIEYKYRINGDWELAEFPNGPNRTHTVLPGTNVITVWYNDQIPPSPGNDVLVDFEDGTWGKLTAHTLGCGTYDYLPLEESFTIIDNPDPSGLNTSSKVCKFRRWGTDYGALSWGGFWANVFPEVDMDINKYVRVKIWKPRITPIRFKLEAGSAGTLEIESMAPQTLINEWEEIIFDFSLLWGSYPIVVFLPDYESPLTITSYIDLYFDDIIVGDLITEMKDPVLSTVNIFPNPVTDNLVISNINDIKWIEIFNTTGQLAKTINTSGEIGQVQINIADLKQGVYILTICSEMSTTSMKLIKKK